MPSYKQLLQMLREGRRPAEIVRLIELRPSRWRRMLSGKRFQDALRMEEDLSVLMAAHGVTALACGAAERLGELLESDKPETARKVALTLLTEAVQRVGAGRPGADAKGAGRGQSKPWTLLRPVSELAAPEDLEFDFDDDESSRTDEADDADESEE